MMRPTLAATAAITAVLSFALCACVTEPSSDPRQPGKPDLEKAAHINTQLGLTYASQGQMEVAEVKLKKALDQDDQLAQAHAGLGYVYWQLNNIDGAQAEFHRAIELDGNDPDTRNNYGVFLCSQKQYDEGDSNFMLVLKSPGYSTPAKAWTNAGVCAKQAGDAARAEADFRKALQSDPNFPSALSEMAGYSYQQQNYLASRAFLERYFKVAEQTPPLLLLGYRTERALGNDDAANQYSVKLVRSYPESDEAAQLLKLRATAP